MMRKYLILLPGLFFIQACAVITGLKITQTLPTYTAEVEQVIPPAAVLSSTPTPTLPLPLPQVNPSGKPAPRFASLRMFTNDTGWAVGAEPEAAQLIFRTQDGGYNWTYAGPPQLDAIPVGTNAHAYFLDAEHAWVSYYPAVAPANGPSSVWRTQDGGLSWTPGFTPPPHPDIPDYAFEGLYFSDPQTGWLMLAHSPGAGHAPVSLFRSRDAGAHWETLLDPFEGQADRLHTCCRGGMLFVDRQNGLVAYAGGPYTAPMVHITRDGGSTWRSIELPLADPEEFEGAACGSESLSQLSGSKVALVVSCFDLERLEPGSLANLYISEDAGMSWRSLPLPEEPFEGSASGNLQREYHVQFIDAQNGWLFLQVQDWSQGETPVVHTSLYQTQDGGSLWTPRARLNWIGEFSFSDPLNGWAITRLGDDLGLLRTQDGGGSWIPLNPVLPEE